MLGSGIAKGMVTTLWHFFFVKPVTLQYPEERAELPQWTRGRPRLIYDVDSGDLRCTACGACALACPVDVIKIEQHPSPAGKGKVLDRFDLDMGGCIQCGLCVEACPFRAIVMAPDFEFATYDRTRSLVFNMHELRIAGTPEVDSAMEYIQGVKRGLAGQQAKAGPAAAGAAPAGRPAPAAKAAGPARPAAGAAKPAAPSAAPPKVAAPAGSAAARPAGAAVAEKPAPGGAGGALTSGQQAASSKSGPLGFTQDLAGLSPAERAKIYKERAAAAGLGRPAPKE
ncbi:MAG: NADH-quinone oxidoreductase subunit I [Chloroflexi bacterium]|nr:NADH-quinone oxidoreductase subunit I [Chloroflexota bacterium]